MLDICRFACNNDTYTYMIFRYRQCECQTQKPNMEQQQSVIFGHVHAYRYWL